MPASIVEATDNRFGCPNELLDRRAESEVNMGSESSTAAQDPAKLSLACALHVAGGA